MRKMTRNLMMIGIAGTAGYFASKYSKDIAKKFKKQSKKVKAQVNNMQNSVK